MPGHKGGWVLIRDAIKKALPEEAPLPASLIEVANDAAPADEAPAEEAVAEDAPAEAPAEEAAAEEQKDD